MAMIKLAVLLLLLLPYTSAGSTAFRYNDDLSCDRGLSASSLSVACDGGDSCSLGSTAKISGSLSLSSELPTSAKLYGKICFLYVICYDFEEENVDLCDRAGLTAGSGQSCADTGDYSIDTSLEVPGKPKDLMSGWSLKVTAYLEDNNNEIGTTKCTFSVAAVQGYTTTYTGFAALGMASLVLALYVRKKRRVGRINLLDEEDKAAPSGNFEMMTENKVIV